MRLIDADKLEKNMTARAAMDKDKARSTWAKAISMIHDEPSAQPEPKRGEWTPIHKGERGFSAGDFRCSVCHQPNKCYIVTNYCSHCGALMRDK